MLLWIASDHLGLTDSFWIVSWTPIVLSALLDCQDAVLQVCKKDEYFHNTFILWF